MSKNRVTVYTLFLSSLISFFCTSVVLADQFHYNHILIGNRAAGLAGSYVAISDDPSGLYYNPSGIVYATAGNISANMNAYNINRTKYIGALTSASGKSIDWVRTSSTLVPSFFGITQPLGRGTVGFSYAITDSILENQKQNFSDINQAGTKLTINFNNQDVTNNVGPSYALSINKNFSIGLTVYGYFRSQERIFNQVYQLAKEPTLSSPAFLIANQYLSLREYGVKPILGMTYAPFNKLSLGLSLSQVFLIKSTMDLQSSESINICGRAPQVRCDSSNPTSFSLNQQTLSEKRKFPWKLSVGAAYFYNNRLMLTGTAWVYEAINGTTRPLVNVAGGIEYYLTHKIAVRMGGYTNLANTPKLTPGAINLYNEHLNIVGATFSLTHFTRASAISLGMAGSYGRGQAQVTGGTRIQEVRYMGMSVFLSASNSF